MKNLSNKILYVNDNGEELIIPLSRFLVGHTNNSDTVLDLYFDSHYEGAFGSAANKVQVTCSSNADIVFQNILGAFASSRGSILDLANIDSRISSVEVTQETVDGMGVLAMEPGSGFSNGSSVHKSSIKREGQFIKTTIFIDLTDLNSGGTAKDVIGKAATANCHIGQVTAAKNGTIVAGRITCLETPTTGEPDIDIVENTLATLTEDTAFDASGTSATICAPGVDFISTATANQFNTASFTTMPTADRYLYLATIDNATDNTYDAGKFLIEMWGV